MANRGRKTNNKGRSDDGPRYIQFYHWMMETPAFHYLSPDGRSALIYLTKRYDGSNNGKIGFGVRSGGFVRNGGDHKLLDVPIMSRTRMHNALSEVQAFKFATVTKASTFGQKKLTREWRLTWWPCDGRIATKEFMSLTIKDCERIRTELKTKASPARRTIPPHTVPPAGHGKPSIGVNVPVQSRPQDYDGFPQSRPQDTSSNHRLGEQGPEKIPA